MHRFNHLSRILHTSLVPKSMFFLTFLLNISFRSLFQARTCRNHFIVQFDACHHVRNLESVVTYNSGLPSGSEFLRQRRRNFQPALEAGQHGEAGADATRMHHSVTVAFLDAGTEHARYHGYQRREHGHQCWPRRVQRALGAGPRNAALPIFVVDRYPPFDRVRYQLPYSGCGRSLPMRTSTVAFVRSFVVARKCSLIAAASDRLAYHIAIFQDYQAKFAAGNYVLRPLLSSSAPSQQQHSGT